MRNFRPRDKKDKKFFKGKDKPYGKNPAGSKFKEGKEPAGSKFRKGKEADSKFRKGKEFSSKFRKGKEPTGSKHHPDFYGSKRKTFSKRRRDDTKSLAGDDGLIRLNKYVSNSGVCSRREADDFIKAGLVSVNGKIVTEMGVKVNPGDVVRFHDRIISPERMVYVLLNKPKDYITTTDDPFERNTVMELVKDACRERIYPVGRLDRNTTGLLLFTNDGDLAKKLMHPSLEVAKIYHVELDFNLRGEDMDAIRKGITLEDGFIKVDDINYAVTPETKGLDKKQIGIQIHSGRNRIVRKIFEHLGYNIRKLDRVVYAGLTKKDLPRGRWRFLSPIEVASLKMMTGKKKFRVN
jgi:23S rRNA pseudouridine2605 synthase